MDAAASGQSPPGKQEPVDADPERAPEADIAGSEAPKRACAKTPGRRYSGHAIAIHQGGRGAGSHQGTGLDHIGFAVKDLKAFIIDESGVGIAFITNIE